MSHEVAILGVGMHPYGKWGRSFVEYGVHAARAALTPFPRWRRTRRLKSARLPGTVAYMDPGGRGLHIWVPVEEVCVEPNI